MSLTPKQARFVEEYLIDLNATQAAIRARYSEKTAKSAGHENLTKPDIQAAITEAMQLRSPDGAWYPAGVETGERRVGSSIRTDLDERVERHGVDELPVRIERQSRTRMVRRLNELVSDEQDRAEARMAAGGRNPTEASTQHVFRSA